MEFLVIDMRVPPNGFDTMTSPAGSAEYGAT
jgi:hypothetical protein